MLCSCVDFLTATRVAVDEPTNRARAGEDQVGFRFMRFSGALASGSKWWSASQESGRAWMYKAAGWRLEHEHETSCSGIASLSQRCRGHLRVTIPTCRVERHAEKHDTSVCGMRTTVSVGAAAEEALLYSTGIAISGQAVGL